MLKKVLLLGAVLSLAVVSITCQRLPEWQPDQVPMIAPAMEPIAVESGDLVAVTPHPTNARWVALWFQKPDKTISVRWVNVTRGKVGPEVTIPRQ